VIPCPFLHSYTPNTKNPPVVSWNQASTPPIPPWLLFPRLYVDPRPFGDSRPLIPIPLRAFKVVVRGLSDESPIRLFPFLLCFLSIFIDRLCISPFPPVCPSTPPRESSFFSLLRFPFPRQLGVLSPFANFKVAKSALLEFLDFFYVPLPGPLAAIAKCSGVEDFASKLGTGTSFVIDRLTPVD